MKHTDRWFVLLLVVMLAGGAGILAWGAWTLIAQGGGVVIAGVGVGCLAVGYLGGAVMFAAGLIRGRW